MTYKGHVRNGVIVLEGQPDLPEGIEVAVAIPSGPDNSTWADRLRGVIGTVDDLPEDMGMNHDHYLHGAPEK